LLFSYCAEALVLIEETGGSVSDFLLFNSPFLTESVEDICFAIENLNCSLLGNILESDNTVRDTGRSENPDPAYLCGVVGMGSTTSLSVDTFDLDYSELVSWHNTSLIEGETVLSLSLSLVHEALLNVNALVNQPVSCVFNFFLFILGQTLVMGDVKMSFLFSLLGSCLPNMGTKGFTAGSKDKMSTRVMSLQLSSSILVNLTFN